MKKLVEEIPDYINNLLNTELSPLFFYHNLQHTKDVVKSATLIADHYHLSEDEKELLLISAWFHDTGYIKSVENHEEQSVQIMKNYLEDKNYPAGRIKIISEIILATKIPQNPQNILEEILCDADIAYIGSDILLEKISLLRREWENSIPRNFTDSEWIGQNINFIEANPFHTDFAVEKFSSGRMNNLKNLRQIAADINNNKRL